MREKEGSAKGLKHRERWEWARCSAGNAPGVAGLGGEVTATQSVEEILGRVESTPCASANGRKKMALTGGAEAAATQREEKKRGDVASPEPTDRDRMATIQGG